MRRTGARYAPAMGRLGGLRVRWRRAGLLGALAALLALASAPAAPALDLPADTYGSLGLVPPGVNDFSCRPPARHPYPVVVVHGTFGDMTFTTPAIAPVLQRLGYCVFALDYGRRATLPIEQSAAELGRFVDRVLAATGARRVSLVGHSQGGMMPRYWIKFLGGAAKADDLIGFSPSNHGTATDGADWAARYFDCPACAQQQAGSAFMQTLNAGDETPAPVSYTVIETRYDEVVTPYASEFLPPTSDGRVTNVLLQDRCPADLSEHSGIIFDPVALEWMLDALGRRGPADPAFRPDCTGLAALTWPDSNSGTVPEPAAAVGR
jgi:triacylglycerol lipase